MLLTTAHIAKLIGVTPYKLYKKCNITNGNHFIWVTREIIRNEWYGIGEDGRTYMIELLGMLIGCGNGRGGEMLSELFMNDMIVYKIPYINTLAQVYKRNSPFLTLKRGKAR